MFCNQLAIGRYHVEFQDFEGYRRIEISLGVYNELAMTLSSRLTFLDCFSTVALPQLEMIIIFRSNLRQRCVE
jgi:hypothetical protein